MKPETRHRLLTVALELRLGSFAATQGRAENFPPERLVEVAQVLEDLARDEEAANGNRIARARTRKGFA